MNRFLVIPCLILLSLTTSQAETVRVFILAGQSNMEGKAKLTLLRHQASQPETQERFGHLITKDGEWVQREDVWIKYLERSGKLEAGYGSRDRFGPELGFGFTVGDALDEPILLIKTAWGGKSLYRDFRPPSSGLPDDAVLADLLQKAQKKKPATTEQEIEESFGHFYRLMVEDVRTTLADVGSTFPDLKGATPEISGLVWFQGWNDMVNPQYVAQYEGHMVNFIKDVRRDLESPELPVVIGQLGVGGTDSEKPNPRRDEFKEAQAAAAERPEFKGSVAVVRTDQYWDTEAQAVFDKGWKQNIEAWEKVGSDYPFHYLGSAKTYLAIGNAFGEAMLDLMK